MAPPENETKDNIDPDTQMEIDYENAEEEETGGEDFEEEADMNEEKEEEVLDEESYKDQVKEIEAEMLQFVKSQSHGSVVLAEHQEQEAIPDIPPLDPELTMDG